MARPKVAPEDQCKCVHVSFTPALLERLMKFCQKEERSISWVVRKALEQYLSERGE